VQQTVDDALVSATEAGKKTSKEADIRFKNAIVALCAYERKYYLRVTVPYAMAEAEAMDKPLCRAYTAFVSTRHATVVYRQLRSHRCFEPMAFK
jgi:hypothetical protein